MVLYFSGTGNSYQAAMAMLSEGEAIEDMAKCLREERFSFNLAADEPLGFVCPVYFGGVPSVVKSFIEGLTLNAAPAYCYAVLTCGGSPSAAGGMLASLLKKRGVELKAVFPVTMPDNYVVMFKIDEAAEQDAILSKAALRLEHIKKQVDRRQRTDMHFSLKDRALTAAMYPVYEHGRSTKPFFADDQCVGCGLCAQRCPVNAIEMKDGRPSWVKDKCCQCMACARCGAIQYGKLTKGKKRYTNPILRKAKGSSHDHGDAVPEGGHDHGAAAGGHDHGAAAGGHDCCSPESGHDHGNAQASGHDCCPPESGHDHGNSQASGHDHAGKCC